ncbi:hypothetical protein AB0K21_37850 [Streptosporangium sp. NPDC049248]|uniref:hypothetical protein n=1 Tax=Streptosporangium sp. NPDC049248 TaxID=3155651 RepID=UPI003426230B
MSAPDEPGPALIATGAYLPGSVCDPIWRVLRAYLAKHQADGGHILPEIVTALEVLRAAGQLHTIASGRGRPSLPVAEISASSSEQALITTDQLAARLGVTPRQARNIARDRHVQPVARGLWRADDATALEVARTRR